MYCMLRGVPFDGWHFFSFIYIVLALVRRTRDVLSGKSIDQSIHRPVGRSVGLTLLRNREREENLLRLPHWEEFRFSAAARPAFGNCTAERRIISETFFSSFSYFSFSFFLFLFLFLFYIPFLDPLVDCISALLFAAVRSFPSMCCIDLLQVNVFFTLNHFCFEQQLCTTHYTII